MRSPFLLLRQCVLGGCVLTAACLAGSGQKPEMVPRVNSLTVTNGQAHVSFQPAPATEEYRILWAPALNGPFDPASGLTSGFEWTGPLAGSEESFFRIEANQLSPPDLLATTVLNRLAYGPTPDDLARVRAMGPDAYIAEQLAAESVPAELDTLDLTPRWKQVTESGLGSASQIYLYMDGAGEAYIDDLRLVAGLGDDGSKPNLLKNGDFESALGPTWVLSPNVSGSARNAQFVHSGGASLHLVSTAAGTTKASSCYQTITPNLDPLQTYTLSYWYLTSGDSARLTVRLSGSGIVSNHGLSGQENTPAPLYAKLQAGEATRADLRAWHILHAIQSPRQLNEVLRQFLENHFVTEAGKTLDYFANHGYSGPMAEQLAARTEFAENIRWRQALLNPAVTFLDLLRISAESPAMILYLDTIASRGDGSSVANENYARELCELFCLGVDNGYDQNDIVQISRAWTGWRIELFNPADEFNPLAPRSTNYVDSTVPAARLNANTNVLGVWGFKYRPSRHNNSAKYIFYQWNAQGKRLGSKQVPARFGPPWAGRDYGLALPARSGNASLQDGYELLQHLANQPFTEEFISVKLCRLFVHDDFQIGYDFTDDVTSPEEELVKHCMLAWEAGNPKGQFRDVLRVIFNSALFRSHDGSLQKVKTPLEFGVSAIRALRARQPDGSYTAETDGYGLNSMLNQAGRMRLFDRVEPNGYPEDAPGWISGGTLAERLRFVQAALLPAGAANKEDAGVKTRMDPVALLRLNVTTPAGQRDAGLVADFFLRTLFPAEGTANLAAYRALAVNFLNTADNGVSASPLEHLAPDSAAYDMRVRGMVAFLLTTQRFQEQ